MKVLSAPPASFSRSRAILIYTLLAGAVAGPVRLNCSTLADDPGGWSKAKWGMTEAQLADAFGPANIVREPLAGGATAPGVDVEIDGRPFRAVFGLKDGKLSGVSLSPRQDKDRTAFSFQSIVDLLVEKYGRPWKSETGQMLRTVEYQWTLPTTVISVSFTTAPGLSDTAILNLHYARRHSDPL